MAAPHFTDNTRGRLAELAADTQEIADEISRLDDLRGGGLIAHWLAMAAAGLRDEIKRTGASA